MGGLAISSCQQGRISRLRTERESRASFLLSTAHINERSCEVPVYEFRFC